jgi:hypothetical protein
LGSGRNALETAQQNTVRLRKFGGPAVKYSVNAWGVLYDSCTLLVAENIVKEKCHLSYGMRIKGNFWELKSFHVG